ncbi:MAG TPA: translation elongation factor Ts [Candidatus Hydrogenedentes bacterium]|jgi:elongation factor Ts|nr:translation elongation factor Ts [Candidatus Hydrogenedentota bacterium]HOM48275.1 translation elongation factor Ts [Candidatus Hydrogenedentota bacterium]HOR50013.1 translation elongation factor Ts [Candidatus Hydrogenedentota bacterium]HPK24355.1 translation elongation factor Ts [Candidatus Hydrogenedentota bacterium]HPX85330.1 translation elongation factor Ts [Candidatus Hydrogenedentota bacterium]
MTISAATVKELRDATGAGMMDCKRALEEKNGNFEEAIKYLREKGMAKAAKRASKVAAEGAVASYIHMGGKIGVLVEVNSETDFVARGDAFQAFVRDICLQICSASPTYISPDEIPAAALAAEKEVYVNQALATGKPEAMCEKIAEGKLKKWYSEVCLLEQPFVKDDKKSIKDLIADLTSKCGEKIVIRRFVRFQLGEGIEKEKVDLAAEVAAELAKVEK